MQAMIETFESRIFYSASGTTTPPPPPPPPPGVVLNKGVLCVVADPKTANTISVNLSKDGKSINVNYDGKASSYKVSDVQDVRVQGATKADKVTVDLSGLAPKTAPKNPPPAPPAGVNLKSGLLTIAGDPKTANTVAITASADGKSVTVKLDGKSSTFSSKDITDITVFDGMKADSVSVDLGGVKLAHPVLVHGMFASDTVIGGNVVYDLPLAPPVASGGTDKT